MKFNYDSIGSYLWHWNYKQDRPVHITPDDNCFLIGLSLDDVLKLEEYIKSQGHPHLKEWTLTYQPSTGCFYWQK